MRRWLLSPLLSLLLALLLGPAACDSPVAPPPQQLPPPARQELAPSRAPAAPVVLLPAGDAPEGGWPVLVMLHGYRSNHHDFVPVGQLAAAKGLAAISLPAPFEAGAGHYHWQQGEPEHTHRYLQAVVAGLPEAKEGALATQRVWLAGFSQGAMHAVHLAARHPRAYRGALAISPAGWTPAPEALVEPEIRRSFVVIGGRAEKARYRDSFAATRDVLAGGGLPLEVVEHDGGHSFPRDWRERFPRVFARWAAEVDAP